MSKNIVILSPIVPETNPFNAGEKLVRNLGTALESLGHRVTFIATDTNHNAQKQTDFTAIVVLAPETGRAHREHEVLRRCRAPFDSFTPHLEFWRAIQQNERALAALRAADVIDLQWSAMVLLAPWVRQLNPGARIVGTLHDVNSQRFARRAQVETHPLKAAAWRAQARAAALLETAVLRWLDTLVVLSGKDAALIPAGGAQDKIRVVTPPIYDEPQDAPLPAKTLSPQPSLVLMGSLARWENLDSLHWLIEQVMPRVWAKHPETTLDVVGPAYPALAQSLTDERVVYRGKVERISDAYVSPWAAVVPLRLGAGVKFKTVDALLNATPCIATYAGAEGIVDTSWLARIAEGPERFAQAICTVIENRAHFASAAQRQVEQVRAVYGMADYRRRVQEVYGA